MNNYIPGQDIYGRDEEAPEPQVRICRWCSGAGSISVDGGSLRYTCPDCKGSGHFVPDED